MNQKQLKVIIIIIGFCAFASIGVIGFVIGIYQAKQDCPLTPESVEFLHGKVFDLPEEYTGIKAIDPVAIVNLGDTSFIIPRKFESIYEEGSDGYIEDVIHFVHPEFSAEQVEDYLFNNK